MPEECGGGESKFFDVVAWSIFHLIFTPRIGAHSA